MLQMMSQPTLPAARFGEALGIGAVSPAEDEHNVNPTGKFRCCALSPDCS